MGCTKRTKQCGEKLAWITKLFQQPQYRQLPTAQQLQVSANAIIASLPPRSVKKLIKLSICCKDDTFRLFRGAAFRNIPYCKESLDERNKGLSIEVTARAHWTSGPLFQYDD